MLQLEVCGAFPQQQAVTVQQFDSGVLPNRPEGARHMALASWFSFQL